MRISTRFAWRIGIVAHGSLELRRFRCNRSQPFDDGNEHGVGVCFRPERARPCFSDDPVRYAFIG